MSTELIEKLVAAAERLDRLDDLEALIIADPSVAVEYAKNVIEGRWQKGEPIIMTDAVTAFKYARDVIKGRWKDGERIIMKDPQVAGCYACVIIGSRWYEAEKMISTDHLSKLSYERTFDCKIDSMNHQSQSDDRVLIRHQLRSIKSRWREESDS